MELNLCALRPVEKPAGINTDVCSWYIQRVGADDAVDVSVSVLNQVLLSLNYCHHLEIH